MRRALPSLCLILAVPSFGAGVDFSKEVFPVLQRACFECHGPEQSKGGMRLHERAVFQKADHVEILRRVALPRSDKEAMPKRGAPLSAAEIQALKTWIDAGAIWPEAVRSGKHWSYIPPMRPALPEVKDAAWSKHPVDRFIGTRLDKEGIPHSAEAEPASLLRRLSLHLVGLPPSVAEVETFVKAYRVDADKAVDEAADRLLASKEFGVRWARPWLDAARYADSHGFQRDDLREVWGFRDWVVDALNANMRFDQFTIEQVAGDLLPNATPQQIVATGFHRCTPTNVEAGTEPEESRINQVIDRVNTTGTVWLGSTLECAQCHNHKYDPFTQKDYYSLLSYFNNTQKEAERSNPKTPGSIKFDGVPMALPDGHLNERRVALTSQIADMQTKISEMEKSLASQTNAAKPESANASTALKPLSIDTESGSETELQADQSLLFTGNAPDVDVYQIEYELPAAPISGILLEALSDDSLPGKGPGRGAGKRPNFVLQHLEASVVTAAAKYAAGEPLRFGEVHASFSQGGFPASGLADANPKTGWAIMPKFGQSHWAALELKQPLHAAPGARLRLKLVQQYGGGRVIGRLRVSALQGEVVASLPDGEEAPAPKRDVRWVKLQRQMTALKKQLTDLKPATTEVMRELPEPRMTAIFKRGVYTDHGEPVKAGTPAVIDAKAAEEPNRLSLARWLVHRDNPLTARVTVNRWWAEIFGRGIVPTVEDFGIKGIAASHPELLDWLAVEFMESGWDMKHVLKLIVTSRAYRQSSAMVAGTGMQKDPENALLWRGPRYRMDAEMIRDNALAIAGLLSPKQGGVPIRPPQPEGLWAKVGGQQYKYEVSPGDEQYRRGLYVVLKRGSPYPSFVNFDASARTACVVKRSRSNTPLQALTLLNDPVYVEAAQAFAKRVVKDTPVANVDMRIQHAVKLALVREARPEEAKVLRQLFDQQRKAGGDDKAWVAVAAALLNLDETITIGG
ncbi:MAG: DUF1553 domain-containing protein [Verrucomicrobiota bacterium]